MNQNIIEKFTDLLGKEKVKVNEPMNRHTTFRIGFYCLLHRRNCRRLLRYAVMKNCHILFWEMEAIFW